MGVAKRRPRYRRSASWSARSLSFHRSGVPRYTHQEERVWFLCTRVHRHTTNTTVTHTFRCRGHITNSHVRDTRVRNYQDSKISQNHVGSNSSDAILVLVYLYLFRPTECCRELPSRHSCYLGRKVCLYRGSPRLKAILRDWHGMGDLRLAT